MARDSMDAMRLKASFMSRVEEEMRLEYERKVTALGKIWREMCANRIKRWWIKWYTYQNVIRRNINAIEIQRCYRGWVGRRKAFAWERLAHEKALDMQRVWRGYCGRIYARWYISTMMKLVPAMQRLVRGHIGRVKAHKLKVELEENWNWLNPSMPRAAFNNHLARNTPYRRNIYLDTPDPYYFAEKEIIV